MWNWSILYKFLYSNADPDDFWNLTSSSNVQKMHIYGNILTKTIPICNYYEKLLTTSISYKDLE